VWRMYHKKISRWLCPVPQMSVTVQLKPSAGFCLKTKCQAGIVKLVPAAAPPPKNLLEPERSSVSVPNGRKVFVNIAWDPNVPPPPEGNEEAIQRAMLGQDEPEDLNPDAWFVPVIVSDAKQDTDKGLYQLRIWPRSLARVARTAIPVTLNLTRSRQPETHPSYSTAYSTPPSGHAPSGTPPSGPLSKASLVLITQIDSLPSSHAAPRTRAPTRRSPNLARPLPPNLHPQYRLQRQAPPAYGPHSVLPADIPWRRPKKTSNRRSRDPIRRYA
jgi:hypothetical protein